MKIHGFPFPSFNYRTRKNTFLGFDGYRNGWKQASSLTTLKELA
jgi:hypothetical protein